MVTLCPAKADACMFNTHCVYRYILHIIYCMCIAPGGSIRCPKRVGVYCIMAVYMVTKRVCVCVCAYNILVAVYGVPKEWVCVCIYTGGSIRCPKTVCVYANTLVAVYGDHPPVPPPPSSPLTRPDRPLPSTSCFPGHSLRAPPNDHSTAGSCTNSCWGQNFGTKILCVLLQILTQLASSPADAYAPHGFALKVYLFLAPTSRAAIPSL